MAQFPQCDLLGIRRSFFRLASIEQIDIEQEISISSINLSDKLVLDHNNVAVLNYWVNKLLLALEAAQNAYLHLANEIIQIKTTSFGEAYLMVADELTNWLLQMQKKFLEGGVDNE